MPSWACLAPGLETHSARSLRNVIDELALLPTGFACSSHDFNRRQVPCEPYFAARGGALSGWTPAVTGRKSRRSWRYRISAPP